MKNVILLHIVIFFLMIACKGQGKYNDASLSDLNYVVWNFTNTPWVGHYNDIVEVIGRGANIEYVDSSKITKTTPFLNAAGALECLKRKSTRRAGQLDSMEVEAVKIVKFLASKGANIYATSTSRKLNALHLAACGGREKVISVLVSLGLDINSRDSTKGFGVTPLIHAIGAGDLTTVKAILNAGADINLCSLDGNSPLDWAMYYLRIKGKTFAMPYDDQKTIVEYMQSIGAKHGKNEFKRMLYFDERK